MCQPRDCVLCEHYTRIHLAGKRKIRKPARKEKVKKTPRKKKERDPTRKETVKKTASKEEGGRQPVKRKEVDCQ